MNPGTYSISQKYTAESFSRTDCNISASEQKTVTPVYRRRKSTQFPFLGSQMSYKLSFHISMRKMFGCCYFNYLRYRGVCGFIFQCRFNSFAKTSWIGNCSYRWRKCKCNKNNEVNWNEETRGLKFPAGICTCNMRNGDFVKCLGNGRVNQRAE